MLGEAWMMGLLAGIEDAAGFDLRDCESSLAPRRARSSPRTWWRPFPRRPSAVGTDSSSATPTPARGLAVAALAAAKRAGSFALAASSAFAPLALGVAPRAGRSSGR